nr:uncharacterized protein LOC128705147 [Cherax quadricarinatus]
MVWAYREDGEGKHYTGGRFGSWWSQVGYNWSCPPELPDISAIRLDSNSSGSKTGDATILSSVSENDLSQNSGSSIFHEVTTEELEKEYMSYLQWAYVDTYSEDAFNVQLKNAQV